MSNDKKFLYEQMGGTYAEIDGIFYPNITLGDELAEQNDFCGKYGDMWKKHMHDNRNADYRHYLFTGKLDEKAKEINETYGSHSRNRTFPMIIADYQRYKKRMEEKA